MTDRQIDRIERWHIDRANKQQRIRNKVMGVSDKETLSKKY